MNILTAIIELRPLPEEDRINMSDLRAGLESLGEASRQLGVSFKEAGAALSALARAIPPELHEQEIDTLERELERRGCG